MTKQGEKKTVTSKGEMALRKATPVSELSLFEAMEHQFENIFSRRWGQRFNG